MRPLPRSLIRLLSMALALTLACAAPDAIARRRKDKPKVLPSVPTWSEAPASVPERAVNSLWSSESVALASDLRARRENDVITIRVDESTLAKSLAKTSTKRSSKADFGLPHLGGITERLASASVNPSALVSANASDDFSGDGSTARQESFTTLVTGRVVQVLPNGNLHVEAAREVTINNERQYLLLAGVVRPTDVALDNSVVSTQMADLRLVFAGAGDLSKVQKKNWFLKALSWIVPFI